MTVRCLVGVLLTTMFGMACTMQLARTCPNNVKRESQTHWLYISLHFKQKLFHGASGGPQASDVNTAWRLASAVELYVKGRRILFYVTHVYLRSFKDHRSCSNPFHVWRMHVASALWVRRHLSPKVVHSNLQEEKKKRKKSTWGVNVCVGVIRNVNSHTIAASSPLARSSWLKHLRHIGLPAAVQPAYYTKCFWWIKICLK